MSASSHRILGEWHSGQSRAAEFATAAVGALLPEEHDLRVAVHHKQDQAWSLLSIQKHEQNINRDFDDLFIEVSGSTAFGCTMLAIASRSQKAKTEVPQSLTLEANAPTRVFPLEPNPTFLYENARFTEVWLGLPSATKVTPADGVIFGEVIRLLTEAANSLPAPVLLLEFPASRPSRQSEISDGTEEGPEADSVRRPADLGLRCAIAIPDQDLGKRHEYWKATVDIATVFGLEAWLGDRRQTRGRGTWFPLTPAHQQTYDRHRSSVQLRPVNECHVVPFTAVGPARTGTTLWYIDHITRRFSGIVLGVSMSALADHAVIHLRLACTPSSSTDLITTLSRIGYSGATHLVMDAPFVDQLQLESRAQEPGKDDPVATRYSHSTDLGGSPPSGYEVCIGPALSADFRLNSERVALWGGWQVNQARNAFYFVQQSLFDAVRDLVGEKPQGHRSTQFSAEDLNFEYLSSKRTPNGRLRGRFKLSLPRQMIGLEQGPNYDQAVSDFCYKVEQSWLSRVRRELAAHAEVQLAWEEAGVGRWSSVG